MKVAILPVGQIAQDLLVELARGLTHVFPDTSCQILQEPLPLPKEAFDKHRNQYNSSQILNQIRAYAAQRQEFSRVFGVVEVDVFSAGLTYVFGEAYVAGRAGLVSLWRLKPSFYGEAPSVESLFLRTHKEAVHELGHTMGLQHCPHGLCVMHFSNSIFDTDKKQSLFCSQCYLQAALAINKLG
jgi:archaemetzincin